MGRLPRAVSPPPKSNTPFIRRVVLNSLLNSPLATLVTTVDCGEGSGVANGSLAAHEDRLGWSAAAIYAAYSRYSESEMGFLLLRNSPKQHSSALHCMSAVHTPSLLCCLLFS